MARTTETIVTVSDDVDGSTKDVTTVAFALDGTSYEIDLGPKNAKALRADIEKWVEHARKATRATGQRRRTTRVNSDAAAIRVWASANGIDVPARGRIPASVIEQYQTAGN